MSTCIKCRDFQPDRGVETTYAGLCPECLAGEYMKLVRAVRKLLPDRRLIQGTRPELDIVIACDHPNGWRSTRRLAVLKELAKLTEKRE